MEGKKDVIAHLNQVLTSELTSINQMFLHARMLKNWGLEALNDRAYKKSILDMKQADALVNRVLFLEGLPNLQKLNKLRIGENTEEIFRCDLELIMEQLAVIRDAICCCEQAGDFVSRDILESILKGEEEYVDWLEAQQYLIEHAGLKNYLQSQI